MTAADLPVPDRDAMADIADLLTLAPKNGAGVVTLARAVAAPFVAAELRRFAQSYRDDLGGIVHDLFEAVIRDLERRADEIDPSARAGELGGENDTTNTEGENDADR